MLGMFGGLSLLTRFIIIGGLAASVIGGGSAAYFGWRYHERMIGYRSALDKVAEQDAHARAIATKASQDVDTCERNGGDFDVSTGDCSK